MNRTNGRAVTPSGVSDHTNNLLELLLALDRNPINQWPDLITRATSDCAASAWTRPTTDAAAVALESYVRARMAATSPSAPERGVVARLIVDIRIPELIRRRHLRPCSPHVRRAMACLQRATHSCTIAWLAEKCDCSVATLTRAFRLEVGVTIHRYELGVRLLRAEAVLISGGSVSQAMTAGGFHGRSQFARQFARYFGLAPRAYRRARAIPDETVDLTTVRSATHARQT